MINFTKNTLKKMEELFSELDYVIRYEKGNFKSGYCIVEDRKIVVINKFFDTEGRINVLIDILSAIMVFQETLSDKNQRFYRHLMRSLKLDTIPSI